MKRALVAAAAVAVSVFANSANANPITYAVSAEGTFNGDIFTGQPAGTDFLAGHSLSIAWAAVGLIVWVAPKKSSLQILL